MIAVLIQAANYGSAAAAVVAAVLWFRSAKVDTPTHFPIALDISEGEVRGGSSLALSQLGDALKRQSKLSGWAAIAAAVAAIFGAVSLILQLLGHPES